MNLKSILLLIFSATSLLTQAQGIKLSAEINYGTYRMQSLKEFQTPPSGYYIPLKVVDDFPGFVGFKMHALYPISNKFSTGIYAGFSTTGGKTAYSDYSGSASNTIVCRGYSVGSYNEVKVREFGSYSLAATFLMGVIVNDATFATKGQAMFYTYEDEEKFKSVNMMFNPGASLTRTFDLFFLRALISYEFNFAGDLKSKENGDHLLNFNDPVKVQWDGLRVGLAVGTTLTSKKEKQ